LGKHDLGKPIDLDEGIFFGEYREGVPGMQPERLGPYVSTLNPGYDSTLPLYRPWPMFEAIRDANTGKTNSPWANPPKPDQQASSPMPSQATETTLSYLPANGQRLVDQLSKVGVQPVPFAAKATPQHLLLDGSNASSLDDAAKFAVAGVLDAGGTVWIWNITTNGAKAVSRLLGEEVLVEPREASSFIVKQPVPLLAGLDNAKLYFSENDDRLQMTCGLSGAFVSKSDVVLEASPADWRLWNYRGEPVKTAALFRSEVERTAPRAAIAIRNVGRGRVILCNLNPAVNSPRKLDLVERMMRNEGIEVKKITEQGGFLDDQGHLMKALICGGFGVDDLKNAYGEKLEVGQIKPGVALHGLKWIIRNATEPGMFDFKSYPLEGPQANAFAYVAVWIKSPKPLNDLLSEPNLPKLSFTYGCDDGCQVWLNGERLANNERLGPLEPEMATLNPLLLKLGWNQLVIKVVQADGEWQFAGKFDCTDRNFLQKLEFATEKPGTESE
jgi:beta-galactosidase